MSPAPSQLHSEWRRLRCSTLPWGPRILIHRGIFLWLELWIEFSKHVCTLMHVFKLYMIRCLHQFNMKSCAQGSQCVCLSQQGGSYQSRNDSGPWIAFLEKVTNLSWLTEAQLKGKLESGIMRKCCALEVGADLAGTESFLLCHFQMCSTKRWECHAW